MKNATTEQHHAAIIANRNAWNAVAPVHAKSNQRRLLREVARSDYIALDNHCKVRLKEIGVTGKSVAQIGCNNGRELLSVKNMGAGHCVGFDISSEFVDQGRQLADAAGHSDVEFVETDVYAIPDAYRGPYDVVFNTVGVIGWMPDIEQFFAVCAELTRNGGHLFMEDIHPVLQMYDDADSETSTLQYSYFNSEPWIEADNLDYYNASEYDAPVTHYFQHTLSDIFMAAINAGFSLRHFAELDFDISTVCPDLEHAEANPPMGMTLVWEKS